MYKFIKEYAGQMNEATIYPMISLLIFFVFFLVLLVMVKKMKKEKIHELSNIPFEQEELINKI